MSKDSALDDLEKLHRLKTEGAITEEEFAAAKVDLLSRTVRTAPTETTYPRLEKFDGALPEDSDILGWMLLPLRRYADFSGRSRRKEYWLYTLGMSLAMMFLMVLGVLMGAFTDGGETSFVIFTLLLIVFGLALIVPSLAVAVRRLHDQGKSGWFYLLAFIPYLGGLVLLIFMCIDGEPRANIYGEDPKGRSGD